MTTRSLFWTLLLAGMGLRILWALLVPVVPISDGWAYHQFARTLAEHGTYGWTPDEPTAYWAVGTSALVALTYLVHDGFAGVVVLNLLAGLAILLLTHRLALRWFGEAAALWALALVAFWPNLVFFTTIVSSELFFIAAMLAGLFFWRRPAGPPLVNLALAGLLWGLTAYIRPVVLLVPAALALVELPGGPRRFAAASLRAAAAIALISLVVLPWSLRNEGVFGERVTVSTNFGANLWMGNNPDSTGGYMPLPPEVEGMGEVERSRYLQTLAWDYMSENPLDALGLMGRKLVRLYGRETIGVVWNEEGLRPLVGEGGVLLLKLAATGYWYLLVLGALAGVAVLARRAGPVAALFNPPVALWGYFTLLHVIIVADDRYHMPTSTFVATMAAVALASLGARWSGHPAERMRAGGTT